MNVEINGVSLDVNLFDADFAEDYEAALDEVQGYEPPKNGTLAEIIRDQCECVNRFFDRVFGVGTASAIFGGKHDLNKTADALKVIVEAAEQQGKEFQEKIKSVPSTAQSLSAQSAKTRRFSVNS